MKKLIVAFDHQIFDLQSYGGVSRYVVELATALARQPETAVSIEAPLHINEYLRAMDSSVRRTAAYIGAVPKSRRLAHAINAVLMRPLLQRRKPHVVHRTYYAARQPAVNGARSVITVHDLIHERMGASMAHDVPARDKRRAIAEADHAICISHSTRRDLIELFDVDPQEDLSVVHHGFKLASRHPRFTPAPIAREGVHACMSGLRGNYKNFQALLDAYAAVATHLRERFDIVCFGGPRAFTADGTGRPLPRTGAPAPMRRHARWAGADAASCSIVLPAVLRCWCTPRFTRASACPLLEAMSFGCPVVCCPGSPRCPKWSGDAAAFFEGG